MRLSRVHSVIAGATLASVLAGGSLVANAEAAPRPADRSIQHVMSHQAVQPVADPSSVLSVLGNLGAVQHTVGQLTAMAHAKEAPSAADVQTAAGKVTTAITGLQKSIQEQAGSVAGQHARGLIPAPVAAALKKLQGDVTALVAALTAGPSGLGQVTAALTAIVADVLALVAQTVASLGLSLPVPAAGS